MNDSLRNGAKAVAYARLYSGAKVQEKNAAPDTPEKAVELVVAGLDKAKQSVEKITEAATTRIEVIRQNETSSRVKVEDVDEAIRLSQNLVLNIGSNKKDAEQAHSLDLNAIKELLK